MKERCRLLSDHCNADRYLRYAYEFIADKKLVVALAVMFFVMLQIIMPYTYSAINYAAGRSPEVPVYLVGRALPADENAEGEAGEADGQAEASGKSRFKAVEIRRLVRGTPVKLHKQTRVIDGEVYVKAEEYTPETVFAQQGSGTPQLTTYVRQSDLAESRDDIVRETEVFVRTPVTIYAEKTGPAIASFAPKGSCLKVTGYDKVDRNGLVNKYRVEYDTADGSSAEGYVYGKYLTDTQKKANKKYKGNGIYEKVKKDTYGFNLYGGKASHLDYYPYERPVIEGNEFCADARAMYLTCVSATRPGKYIKLIKSTDCNAVVVDIKDGVLAWPAETAKELSPRSYKTAYASYDDYKKGIDELRETGVYLIGRIVVFNDPIYAKDHPENCIKYGGSAYWPSAFSRDVWEYNVRLAQEAIREFGFNEIQFDYVRFPENSYEMSVSGRAKFRNKYDEEKGQAVQNFCFYAADQIHEAGAYLSVDVFGESAYGYMTAYGQYWPGISNIVDAISAMPYTDHMGGEGSWVHPYDTMKSWAKRAKKQQDYLEHPAAARTWITGYDTPYWAPTTNYGEKQLKRQVKALKDVGLEGGFIPWNASNSLGKYKEYKAIWNK